jgi:hypothetical protein
MESVLQVMENIAWMGCGREEREIKGGSEQSVGKIFELRDGTTRKDVFHCGPFEVFLGIMKSKVCVYDMRVRNKN